MRVPVFVCMGLLACAVSSHAETQQPPALHDKNWYAANTAVRQATLKTCVSDESYAYLYDCRNAADGENLVRATDLRRKSDFLYNPAYWAQNPIARRGAEAICQRGTGAAYPQFEPYCNIVYAASIAARN